VTVVHRGLGAGRWSALSPIEQLGNIGSEVDRAIRASGRNDPESFDRALVRALELFDLTLADPRWSAPRRRELARAREEFCGLFFRSDEVSYDPSRASSYFLQFGLLARRDR
jgi:hypothetical protein